MHAFAEARSAALRKRDLAREAEPDWYKHRSLLGMMLYIDNFAATSTACAKSWITLRRPASTACT